MANFSLKQNEHKPENIFLVKMDPNLISVLQQSRTFMSEEALLELSSSIKSEGQHDAGDVYGFTKEEALNYIRELNDLWDTNHSLSDFSTHFVEEKQDNFYFFLVAGHRRLQACKRIKFSYLCKLAFGKTFEQGIKRQLSENMIREQLSQFDAVTSAVSFWVKTKRKNPKLTLTQFSEEYLGKSISWLSSAIRFSRLPLAIQEMMKGTETEKGVNYSILLAFVSLYDYSILINKTLDEESLITFVNHCVTHKYNFKKVKEFCLIKKQELDGQTEMFPLPTNQEINKSSLEKIRKERVQDMTNAVSYINATGGIRKYITKKCEQKAEKVVDLIRKEDFDLTSGR